LFIFWFISFNDFHFFHDGVEEENLTEHDEDDDASQAEDSQPHNRAVQSITTDKEDKDIETKGNKKVKCIETEKSENKQIEAKDRATSGTGTAYPSGAL
jgi:hypothetical protein